LTEINVNAVEGCERFTLIGAFIWPPTGLKSVAGRAIEGLILDLGGGQRDAAGLIWENGLLRCCAVRASRSEAASRFYLLARVPHSQVIIPLELRDNIIATDIAVS
jgi:hypothetical protein